MTEVEKLQIALKEQDGRLEREKWMLTGACVGSFVGSALVMATGIKAAG